MKLLFNLKDNLTIFHLILYHTTNVIILEEDFNLKKAFLNFFKIKYIYMTFFLKTSK